MKAIRDNLTAFYVRYADENGLTVSNVTQQVNRWDMSQWKQAIDSIDTSNLTSDAETRIKYYAATAGINRNYLIMSILGVKLVMATAKTAVHIASRIKQDVDDTMAVKTGLLNYAKANQDEVNKIHALKRKIYHDHVEDSFEDASQRWSPRLWQKSDEFTRKVQNVVTQHLTSSISIEDLNKRLFPDISEAAKAGSVSREVDSMEYAAQRLIRTESARAVTEVNKEIYRLNGVERVDVVNEPGACPICVDLAEQGPYKLSEVPDIPAHPNCRCSIIPHDESSFDWKTA